MSSWNQPAPHWDVVVIGGGNAALCAALTAAEGGARVIVLESAPQAWRGGNSVHTRNIRCMHDAPQDVLTEAYPEEEFWQDLLKVTGGLTNESLARRVIRDSSTCRPWMQRHGVRFQPALSGALHVSRTNAFFMGGGKALVNAYYRSAERLGIGIRYDSPVDAIELKDGRFIAARIGSTAAGIAGRRIPTQLDLERSDAEPLVAGTQAGFAIHEMAAIVRRAVVSVRPTSALDSSTTLPMRATAYKPTCHASVEM
jgi:precorrin 3B synthase CobZ